MNITGQRTAIDRIIAVADRIDGFVSNLLAAVGCIILVVWFWIITVNFIGRGFFQMSWMFVEEYTKYFNMLIMCFGAGYALRSNSHIRVEMAVNYLPKPTRMVLECITTLIGIWILFQIVSRFWDWTANALKIGEVSLDTGTPMWFLYLVPVVGFGTLIFGLAIHFVRTLVQLARRRAAT